MYNEEIKKKWIELYLADKNMDKDTIISIFNSSEPIEKDSNKDISQFNFIDIKKFYRSLESKSKERLASINSIMKQYTSWCTEKEYAVNDNYFSQLEHEDFLMFIDKRVIENKFISEKKLNSYVEQLDNNCDKLLLLLLYNAIKGVQCCEIVNLNVDQIDGNILHLCSGRDVTVGEELIGLIRATNDTYEYISNGDLRKWELEGNNVFKSAKNSFSSSPSSLYHRFSTRMVVMQKIFNNPELSLSRIGTSGMINALSKNAIENHMSFEDFIISDKSKTILEKYQFNRPASKVMQLYEEYLPHIEKE